MDAAGGSEPAWDLFISHASEDKEAVVRPLAAELQGRGVRVWYDEYELRIGDSLRGRIEDGLARSARGVVVLSPSFFAKHWTGEELSGLSALEAASGRHRLLPVWHELSHAEVAARAPMLADRYAGSTATPIPELAVQIIEALTADTSFALQAPVVALSGALGAVDASTVALELRNLSRTHARYVTLEPRELSGAGVPLTSYSDEVVLAGGTKTVCLRRFPPAGQEAEALYDLLYTDPQQRALKRQRLRFSLAHDVVAAREYVALEMSQLGPEETVTRESLGAWPVLAKNLVEAWLFSQEWLLTGSTSYLRGLRSLDGHPRDP